MTNGLVWLESTFAILDSSVGLSHRLHRLVMTIKGLSLQAYCKSVWNYCHHKLRKVARCKGRSKATLLKLISPLHKHTPPSPYQEAIACDGVCLVAVVVGVIKRVKDIAHACGKREVAVFRANAYIT